MNKENKGLADNHDGDFILNESGTSVSLGLNDDQKIDEEIVAEENENEKAEPFKTDDAVITNDKNAKQAKEK